MKTYPSIDRIPQNIDVYAFDKLDGSNIRVEWTKKRGFSKFGSRHRLFDETDAQLGPAKGIMLAKYEDSLARIFRANRWQKVTAFFEFYGPNSFAGTHELEIDADALTVTLFDVAVDKRGLLEPREFVRTFDAVETAGLIYRGKSNAEFVASVRRGTLPGVTFEGVVCKGSYTSPGLPVMFKVKSDAWLQRLKERCGSDDQLFDELK